MGDTYITQVPRGLDVMAVVVLVLLFFVFRHHGKIQMLEKEHDELVSEGMIINPYASRPTTIVDSGLTSNKALAWGNKIGQGRYDERKSAFMGGYEPPVFWPIGDVERTRSSRSKAEYGVVTIDHVDPSGAVRKMQVMTKDGVIVAGADGQATPYAGFMYTMGADGAYHPCPSRSHMVKGGKCVSPAEGAQFVEVFEDDAHLLSKASGREHFYA